MLVFTRRVQALWLLVACLSLTVSACGGSPNQPSDQYPNVAGTYRGTLQFSVDGQLNENHDAELVVQQNGSEVTLSYSILAFGSTLRDGVTGTISRTGLFTASSSDGGPTTVYTNGCGYVASQSQTLTFTGNNATFSLYMRTDTCGLWSWSGILRR